MKIAIADRCPKCGAIKVGRKRYACGTDRALNQSELCNLREQRPKLLAKIHKLDVGNLNLQKVATDATNELKVMREYVKGIESGTIVLPTVPSADPLTMPADEVVLTQSFV